MFSDKMFSDNSSNHVREFLVKTENFSLFLILPTVTFTPLISYAG